MTFDEFVSKYNGTATDYDSGAGIQCVDLAKLYMDKVLKLQPKAIGNAEAYWNKYHKEPLLYNNFSQVPNKKGYYPQKRRFGCMGKY